MESVLEGDTALPAPSPSSVTQALLQLMARLTRKHSNAVQLLSAGLPKLLLTLPASCLLPALSRLEPHIATVLRQCLEDPATLEAWMESEIKNFFVQRARYVVGWGGSTCHTPA